MQYEKKPDDSSDKKFRVVSLKEMGPRLPLGTVDAATGELRKELASRRWTMRTEKRLGKLRDETKKEGQARFVTMVVAALYERIGGHQFDDLGDIATKQAKQTWHQALASVDQMWFGDVLYAFIWLRRQVVGNSLDLTLTCPRCVTPVSLDGDLDTLDVRTVDKLTQSYWRYALKDPFDVRGKTVAELNMGPARWSVVERSTVNGRLNTGSTKSALIYSSIQSVVGQEDIVLTEDEIDEMSKYDLEAITEQIDEHNIGPDMSVEAECPKCRNPFRTTLDWTYDLFFQVSGRSGVKTT